MTTVAFSHPAYDLVDHDRIVRKPEAPKPQSQFTEEYEILQETARYIEQTLISAYDFTVIPIPGEDASPATSILASSDWQTNPNLLIIINNASGSMLGIFSRSLCLEQGLSKGSMLPYVDRAIKAEYSVLILRPNTNSVVEEVPGEKPVKHIILGSESPEIHALFVWENLVAKSEHIKHIALLGYGNGASLCKDLLLRQMVRSKEDEEEPNRIQAFITIEASKLVEEDDASDLKEFMNTYAVNLECSTAPKGFCLAYRKDKLGSVSASIGLPYGEKEVVNVAAAVHLSIEPVFLYLKIAKLGGQVSKQFINQFAISNGFNNPKTAVIVSPPPSEEPLDSSSSVSAEPPSDTTTPTKRGFFGWMMGSGNRSSKSLVKSAQEQSSESIISVADFDLLKIVGKGAFGKVMLVRKKNGVSAGQVYAMKVLKKSVIAAKGQIENTISEREILCEIRHPFIVRLRFSFQSEDKLYLVTDYYNGGTLFYHLRKARSFPEDRAKFYGAELVLALDHLHSQHIIYRDLKLENILLDHLGHIALTDFGLSKQDIDKTGGASTFCGTAEYIAPELLQVKRYGKAVDWWSFGILLFEMMYGRTPFYDKNRKLMFYRIINTEPMFPPTFSAEAAACISGFLRVNEDDRLGSGVDGAKNIMSTEFFSTIDFEKLYQKELVPPYTPDVANELDTKYVPKAYLQAEAKDSIAEPKKKNDPSLGNFESFTFVGDRGLDS